VPNVAYQYMAAAIMEAQKPFAQRFEEARQAQMAHDKKLGQMRGGKGAVQAYYGDEETAKGWSNRMEQEEQEGRTRPSAYDLKAKAEEMEERQRLMDKLWKDEPERAPKAPRSGYNI